MKKLGVCVSDLSASQLNYLIIKNINNYLEDHFDIDIICFYENLASPCLQPNFALMPIYEAYGYDGKLVATNLRTASKVIHFPLAESKLFYSYDLEWIRFQRKSFIDLYAIYSSQELELATRSEKYVEVMQNAWNRKVSVIKDFNLEEII